jgi:hypothetical protein
MAKCPNLSNLLSLHHGKQDRMASVPTNAPVLHEPSLIHVEDDSHIIADPPQSPTSCHDCLSRNLLNLCMLVYEEPLPTFYSHDKKNKLGKLVCLSHTRWRHIHKTHCAFPNKMARSWMLNPLMLPTTNLSMPTFWKR